MRARWQVAQLRSAYITWLNGCLRSGLKPAKYIPRCLVYCSMKLLVHLLHHIHANVPVQGFRNLCRRGSWREHYLCKNIRSSGCTTRVTTRTTGRHFRSPLPRTLRALLELPTARASQKFNILTRMRSSSRNFIACYMEGRVPGYGKFVCFTRLAGSKQGAWRI